MSRGRVEENAVKWICSGGDLSTPPALSLSDKMFPSKLCNLFAFPALNHCASKPLNLLPRSSLSLSPDCLSVQQLQNSIFTFHTCFGVLRINRLLLLKNIYENGHKGHRWSKQLSRDLTSDVSLHNLTYEGTKRGMGIEGGEGDKKKKDLILGHCYSTRFFLHHCCLFYSDTVYPAVN